jgi:hypothetical protein
VRQADESNIEIKNEKFWVDEPAMSGYYLLNNGETKMAVAPQSEHAEPKAPKHRSPNHPVIDLKAAIEKTAALQGLYGTRPVLYAIFCKAFEYNPVSSRVQQLLASLKAYGLVTIEGMRDARKIAVSPSADRIIRKAPDRDQLIRAAALTPHIYKEVWAHYESDGALPHDDILRQYLVWERPAGSRFAEDAVNGFIRHLRKTLQFAKIIQADKEDEGQDQQGALDDPEDETPQTPANKVRRAPLAPRQKSGPTVIRDFPIPLMSGGIAVVQVPFPMSAEDFDQLQATLEAWKPALTRGAASNAIQSTASTPAEDDEPSFDDEDE